MKNLIEILILNEILKTKQQQLISIGIFISLKYFAKIKKKKRQKIIS